MNPLVAEPTHQRRLLQRGEVTALLQLPDPDIQWLIDTRQLLELRIRGKERFDSKDVIQLIESYKITASRRVQ
jgi:hypothetical protein